jgi:MFS transporter, putative metabolite:H+ symporter
LRKLFTPTVVVAALGYFVDIYDLILFSIVRKPSLTALGLAGQELLDSGIFLLNCQMAGMLLGGVLWGVLADRKGRLSVLYGSILLYSLANMANGAVQSMDMYALLRFIAGIGLAGELGAGITLVAETMPTRSRGAATTIVATIGIAGAVVAGILAEIFDWRTCYYIGGGLGLSLLLLRVGVAESGLFNQVKANTSAGNSRGNFFILFTRPALFRKYIRCIVVGIPVWFVIGILITFSTEFAAALGVRGEVVSGRAVALCYGGLVLGDLSSGMLSQWVGSRKGVMLGFLLLGFCLATAYPLVHNLELGAFYGLCFALGFSVGYWVLFMTMAAEQFGTNIRATVTTTVPNFVRGAVIPLAWLLSLLKPSFGIATAGLIVGGLCYGAAFIAWAGMEESFDNELDFVEE